MKKIKIATAGDNCIDYYDQTKEAYPGGNPVNVAVYIARLGGESTYIGSVGTDDFGQIMIDAIESKHVDTSHLRREEGSTALTHVEIIDGDRVLGDYDEGVLADFSLTEEDFEFIAGYDMLVTGLWGKIEDQVGQVRAMGVPVAFDFATKPEDPVTKKAIGNVDYAFFSDDDKSDEEVVEFMQEMHSKGPGLVCVTRGVKGSMAYDGEKVYSQDIVKCDVVDTMGAGDSFIAGFLYSIAEGKSIEEAMRDGAKNSAITLGYSGAW